MALSVVLKVPVAQAVQARLTVALPAVLTYVPALQAVHGTQAVPAFWSLSQVPLPQATGAAAPPAQY